MVFALTQITSAQVPYFGAPGFRFIKDLYPASRAGGLNFYPYSSIKSGLTPSWTLASADPAAAPANLSVTISSGQALLDAQPASLTNNVTLTFTPEGVATGLNFFNVFLNPTRILQPIVSVGGVFTPPTTLLNGDPVLDGHFYAQCVDFPLFLEAYNFYQRQSGVWTQVDPSFITPSVPVQQGKNRVFGNNAVSKVTSTNFTINAVEVPIYIATQFPIFAYQPARANLRSPASLGVVSVVPYYYVLPLALTATFTNGSPSVQVDYAYRSMVADLTSSVVATTTLAIGGQALAASAYNPATGVLTLATNWAGTTGDQQVTITPVTPGNIYVLSVNLSQLLPTENLTNP